MNVAFSQDLAIKQSLVMSGELQQSLKILQLPINELEKEINKELEENPFLDIDESMKKASEKLDEEFRESFTYKQLIGQFEDISYSNYNYSVEKKEPFDPYSAIAGKETLKDFLMKQIGDLELDSKWVLVCYYLIENIDRRGYLGCCTQDIAEDLKIENSIVEKGLTIIQELQPDGIGARSLKECLILQLRKKKIIDNDLYLMINQHLDLVAQLKFKEVASKMKIELSRVLKYFTVLKSLEPYPSRGFDTGDIDHFIIPEAYIRCINNELVILMNDSRIPSLKINSLYKEILYQPDSKHTCENLKEKLNRAAEFIRSVDHRQRTLYKILETIITLQKEYFLSSEGFLKPMIIKDIATELNLHESTISRAIKGKYIFTPSHLILIKELFTTGIETDNEMDLMSSKDVKKIISNLISCEDKKKPLSDQDISNLLNDQAIHISRRTVAKYRQELNIDTASKRKSYAQFNVTK